MTNTAPRWNRRPEARRDELLNAAVGLLQKSPLAEIKVSDITQAAGTSKGTFYTYFATKEDLYTALNQRYLDELIAVMETTRAASQTDDWFQQTDQVIAAIIDYMYDNDELIEAWAREGDHPDQPDVYAIGMNRIASMFAVEIGEQVAAGKAVCGDPLATAMLFAYAIDGAISYDMMGLTGDQALGRKRLIAAAQNMWRGMLR